MALIREQEQIDIQFSKALDLVGDGHFVYGAGNLYLKAVLFVLKEAMNDQYDYIDWWLYETSDYMIWSGDEKKEWCLKEPAALYDFIVTECQTPPTDEEK